MSDIRQEVRSLEAHVNQMQACLSKFGLRLYAVEELLRKPSLAQRLFGIRSSLEDIQIVERMAKRALKEAKEESDLRVLVNTTETNETIRFLREEVCYLRGLIEGRKSP